MSNETNLPRAGPRDITIDSDGFVSSTFYNHLDFMQPFIEEYRNEDRTGRSRLVRYIVDSLIRDDYHFLRKDTTSNVWAVVDIDTDYGYEIVFRAVDKQLRNLLKAEVFLSEIQVEPSSIFTGGGGQDIVMVKFEQDIPKQPSLQQPEATIQDLHEGVNTTNDDLLDEELMNFVTSKAEPSKFEVMDDVRRNKKIFLDYNDTMSCGPITDDDFIIFADAIPNCTSLRRVAFELHQSVFTITSFRAILHSIRNSRTIQSLRLGGKKLQKEHADVISSLLERGTLPLNEITINNTSIERQGVIRILEGLTKNTTIGKLHLESPCEVNDVTATSEELGAAFANMFTQNETLQVLSVQELSMDHVLLTYFASGMTRCTSLIELNLRRCSINGLEAVQALCRIVEQTKSLSSLDLGHNLLGNDTAYLFETLKRNNTLETLIVSANDISDACAGSIKEALVHNTALKILSVNSNNFTTNGIITITEGLESNQTLEELFIAKNKIESESVLTVLESIEKSLHNNATLRNLIFDFDTTTIDQILENNRDSKYSGGGNQVVTEQLMTPRQQHIFG